MIRLVTRAESRAMDADAESRLSIPSAELMERAGAGATAILVERFPEHLEHVCVVGGIGQNGGDAWVVARLLHVRGVPVTCAVVGAREKIRGDAKPNFDAVLRASIPLVDVRVDADVARFVEVLRASTAVVDGLFGIGLDRPITGLAEHIVERINDSAAKVLALDVPSGVDADTGAVLGVGIHADLTATFGAPKRGLHQAPGRAHAGTIVSVPIGVEVPATSSTTLLDEQSARALIEPRAMDAHKGDAGRVLVVAGSEGRTGAAVLAGRAALRAGAGLVTLSPRPSGFAAVEAKVVEAMTLRHPEAPADAATLLNEFAKGCDAVVVGPGLSLDAAAVTLARTLALSLEVPTVLDADALTAFADDVSLLRSALGPRVLTPHPGEAARLLHRSVEEVQRDRFASAHELARVSGHVVILKGACSIVASPDGALGVCDRGTPALATGGTGDVLAGIVAARLCQSSPFLACQLATWVHAVAGEVAAVGDRGLLAREVADAVPRVLEALLARLPEPRGAARRPQRR